MNPHRRKFYSDTVNNAGKKLNAKVLIFIFLWPHRAYHSKKIKYFVLPGNKGADGIQVVSYRPDQGKVVQEKLEKFWVPDSRIRINNKSDQNMPYHSEEEIRQQVTYVSSLCCIVLTFCMQIVSVMMALCLSTIYVTSILILYICMKFFYGDGSAT